MEGGLECGTCKPNLNLKKNNLLRRTVLPLLVRAHRHGMKERGGKRWDWDVGPVDQIRSIKKKKKLETHHTVAAGAGTGASPWQRGGIGMWNLYTEPVSVKKELQLTTEPKEWQGQRVGEVC